MANERKYVKQIDADDNNNSVNLSSELESADVINFRIKYNTLKDLIIAKAVLAIGTQSGNIISVDNAITATIEKSLAKSMYKLIFQVHNSKDTDISNEKDNSLETAIAKFQELDTIKTQIVLKIIDNITKTNSILPPKFNNVIGESNTFDFLCLSCIPRPHVINTVIDQEIDDCLDNAHRAYRMSVTAKSSITNDVILGTLNKKVSGGADGKESYQVVGFEKQTLKDAVGDKPDLLHLPNNAVKLTVSGLELIDTKDNESKCVLILASGKKMHINRQLAMLDINTTTKPSKDSGGGIGTLDAPAQAETIKHSKIELKDGDILVITNNGTDQASLWLKPTGKDDFTDKLGIKSCVPASSHVATALDASDIIYGKV